MKPEEEVPAWGGAIQSAIEDAGDEDDEVNLNVVSGSGLPGVSVGDADSKELPYVTLLKAAVTMVQSGEITVEQYVEGVSKLDAIADNALKIYAIPAVKKDLPGKLTDYQNSIVSGLEAEIHKLKEGLGRLLNYPSSQSQEDLEVGLELAVNALNASAEIQKKAEVERAEVLQREKDERARRGQQAAEAEEEEESDSD